jgi:GNAT superfamily N-acetyltransferase
MTIRPITIRPMQPDHLPAGLRLSQAAQWSHRLEDWQFHFRLGRGWMASDDSNAMLGTATWWSYGEHHGSVGLVLVDPSQQGKGIGRKLMDTIIDDAGSRSLQLVATQAGLKLYKQCGFREVGLIEQRQSTISSPVEAPSSNAVFREVTAGDLELLRDLDAAAFGAPRHDLMQHLLTVGSGFVATLDGRPAGFVMKRQAGRGTLIGPVVASSDSLALALIAQAIHSSTGFVRIDIPSSAQHLARWLDGVGLVKVDTVTAMRRGDDPKGNTGAWTYALVSQAFG